MKYRVVIKPGNDGAGGEYGQESIELSLFDLDNDPGQERPIRDPDVERTMTAKMVTLMKVLRY